MTSLLAALTRIYIQRFLCIYVREYVCTATICSSGIITCGEKHHGGPSPDHAAHPFVCVCVCVRMHVNVHSFPCADRCGRVSYETYGYCLGKSMMRIFVRRRAKRSFEAPKRRPRPSGNGSRRCLCISVYLYTYIHIHRRVVCWCWFWSCKFNSSIQREYVHR